MARKKNSSPEITISFSDKQLSAYNYISQCSNLMVLQQAIFCNDSEENRIYLTVKKFIHP